MSSAPFSRVSRVRPAPRPPRGAVLAVVLILLVVMSLLAILSLRGTLLQERMAGNMLDRSLGFQAAEAALRAGEALARSARTGAVTIPTSGCSGGLCARPDPSAPPRWEDETVWADAREIAVEVNGTTLRPRYIVELLADDVPPRGSCVTAEDVSPDAACGGREHRYRITARSQAAGRAEVILQSHYAVP